MDNFHFDEDLNGGDGYMYWSFVVERNDVSGNNSSTPVKNNCPFDSTVKNYIERFIRDVINIAVDNFKIRNYLKLSHMLDEMHAELVKIDKMPTINNFKVCGDPEGIRIIIYAGRGYAVHFMWTLYNDYKDSVIEWYTRNGIDWIKKWITDTTKEQNKTEKEDNKEENNG